MHQKESARRRKKSRREKKKTKNRKRKQSQAGRGELDEEKRSTASSLGIRIETFIILTDCISHVEYASNWKTPTSGVCV